jgi:hypothetical protein
VTTNGKPNNHPQMATITGEMAVSTSPDAMPSETSRLADIPQLFSTTGASEQR